MRTTSELRSLWAPACTRKGDVFIEAYAALDHVLHAHNYAPRKADTGAWNCRHITGGTGYSLHAYGPGDTFTFWSGATVTTALAVDINWTTNPYGSVLHTDMPADMVADIEAIKTTQGLQVWRWGGRYSGNKDAMHFEVVVSPAELAAGISASEEIFTMDAEARAAFAKLEAELADVSAHLDDTTKRIRLLFEDNWDGGNLGWLDARLKKTGDSVVSRIKAALKA